MTTPSAAQLMRNLKPEERDRLIAAADNVVDARERFIHRMKQVRIARSYRKPKKPDGVA